MKSFKKVNGITALVKMNDNRSFVSGDQKDRINIEYYYNQDNGHVLAKVIFGSLAQGPPNHAHGGAISAVLDEAMGAATWLNGYPSMTIKLVVKFMNALPLEIETEAETWIDKIEDKKIRVKGKITGKNGKMFAKSEGIFLIQTKKKFQEFGEVPEELFHLHLP